MNVVNYSYSKLNLINYKVKTKNAANTTETTKTKHWNSFEKSEPV